MEGIPFIYRLIRGGVGKDFVIKHYKGGKIVKTNFPDMSRIVPTAKQKVRRNLFREAVVWAKWIIADEERKRAFRMTLPRKKRKNVYQAALRLYMRMHGNKQWLRKVLAVKALVRGAKHVEVIYETSNVKARYINDDWPMVKGYEQQGPWRVLWEKDRG